jgi:hypothetical protein
MNEQVAEVIELSLVKTIETKLVQANVTEQVIAALKEKYAGMKLAAIDDKESYLEIKAAAKECAKVRTLTVKICKEGREEAVKAQKQWIAKEKEVVGQVSEIEDPLDAEISRFDAEVERLATEEKNRQEEAYISRQAILTKIGAVYNDGCFNLGGASFEANLVKGCSETIWEGDVIPKFQEEYNKIEVVRIAAEKKKSEEEAAMKAEQEKLRAEQEAFKLQQEEFKKQQDEVNRIEREKAIALENEMLLAQREAQFKIMQEQAEAAAEAKRVADVEKAKQDAILAEQKRVADAAEALRQEAIKKQAEIEAANDKTKWVEFTKQVRELGEFEMKSSYFRKKMQIAKEKIEEILAL